MRKVINLNSNGEFYKGFNQVPENSEVKEIVNNNKSKIKLYALIIILGFVCIGPFGCRVAVA